jgi:hypothetical protein
MGSGFDQLISFISDVGGKVAALVQTIAGNRIGAFFLGVFVVLTLFRMTVARIKR